MPQIRIQAVALLAALSLAPAARAADFEGVLEGRMTGARMNGTFKAVVGKGGVRSEATMSFGAKEGKEAQAMPQTHHRVSLWRQKEPDVVYLLDEARKTYSVLDVKRAREASRGADAEKDKWKVKRLGKDKVAGFSCEKVVAQHGEGREMELCVTSEISSRGALSRSLVDDSPAGGGLFQALKDAKVEGFPIRWKVKDEATMEVVSARRQSVPASTFELPAGWKKQEGPMGLSSEQQQQLDEAMKKLTPEQRKKMEEMMKGSGR